MTHSDHLESVHREDLRALSYYEFGQLLEMLTRNVLGTCRERGIQIDLVAPILRSGGFPGFHLASKLKVSLVLPLQYPHTYASSCSVRRFHRNLILPDGLPVDATVLITDTNTVTGEVARCAAADMRAVLPDCRIVFASVMLDISLDSLPGIDCVIAARRTNERRTLCQEAAQRVGVSNDVYIFPWEEVEEQWEQIQAAERADAGERLRHGKIDAAG
jgi:hypothetical protein